MMDTEKKCTKCGLVKPLSDFPRRRDPRKMPSAQRIAAYQHRSSSKPQSCGGGNRIERAHLVAVSDGGSDEVENLALLCHRCHKDMDNFLPLVDGSFTELAVRDLALKWIATRESDVERLFREVAHQTRIFKHQNGVGAFLGGRDFVKEWPA